MKLSLSVFALACSLCAASTASAQLGATKHELISHFGSVTSSTKEETAEETVTFERPGRLVIASLVNGKCTSISTNSIAEPLSNAEVRRILDANAQGKRWERSPEDAEFWRRSDGAVAYINPRSIDIVASAAEGYAPPGSSELKKDLEVAQPKSPQPIKP